jgi:hypothetical protein
MNIENGIKNGVESGVKDSNPNSNPELNPSTDCLVVPSFVEFKVESCWWQPLSDLFKGKS